MKLDDVDDDGDDEEEDGERRGEQWRGLAHARRCIVRKQGYSCCGSPDRLGTFMRRGLVVGFSFSAAGRSGVVVGCRSIPS